MYIVVCWVLATTGSVLCVRCSSHCCVLCPIFQKTAICCYVSVVQWIVSSFVQLQLGSYWSCFAMAVVVHVAASITLPVIADPVVVAGSATPQQPASAASCFHGWISSAASSYQVQQIVIKCSKCQCDLLIPFGCCPSYSCFMLSSPIHLMCLYLSLPWQPLFGYVVRFHGYFGYGYVVRFQGYVQSGSVAIL